jgi:hypothetical protein
MDELTGLFNLPGEGIVAQLRNGTASSLYDKQGLQFLILERKSRGEDTQVAEKALARINALQGTSGIHFFNP